MKKTIIAATIAMGAAMSAQAEELRIAIGGKGNMYHQQAQAFVKRNSLAIMEAGFTSYKYIPTGGTKEIVHMVETGKAHMGMAQLSYVSQNPLQNSIASGKMFREPVYMICNKDGEVERDKVTSYSDFKDSKTTVGMVRNSGAEIVWKRSVSLDSSLKAQPNFNFKKESKLFRAVARGTVDCALTVSGAKSKKLQKLDKKAGKFLRLVPFDGYALNNSGEFGHVEVSSGLFKNLTGWGDIDTIADYAVMVYTGNNEDLDEIIADDLLYNRESIRKLAGDDAVDDD